MAGEADGTAVGQGRASRIGQQDGEDLDAADLIADYDFDGGDRIDLSALFDSITPNTVGDHVQWDGSTLRVDIYGAGTDHGFTNVATFAGSPTN